MEAESTNRFKPSNSKGKIMEGVCGETDPSAAVLASNLSRIPCQETPKPQSFGNRKGYQGKMSKHLLAAAESFQLPVLLGLYSLYKHQHFSVLTKDLRLVRGKNPKPNNHTNQLIKKPHLNPKPASYFI